MEKHWRWFVYVPVLVLCVYSWAQGFAWLAPFGVALAAWPLRMDLILESKPLPITDADIWVWLDGRRR